MSEKFDVVAQHLHRHLPTSAIRGGPDMLAKRESQFAPDFRNHAGEVCPHQKLLVREHPVAIQATEALIHGSPDEAGACKRVPQYVRQSKFQCPKIQVFGTHSDFAIIADPSDSGAAREDVQLRVIREFLGNNE